MVSTFYFGYVDCRPFSFSLLRFGGVNHKKLKAYSNFGTHSRNRRKNVQLHIAFIDYSEKLIKFRHMVLVMKIKKQI